MSSNALNRTWMAIVVVALVSPLAIAGGLTAAAVPDDVADVYGLAGFYRAWDLAFLEPHVAREDAEDGRVELAAFGETHTLAVTRVSMTVGSALLREDGTAEGPVAPAFSPQFYEATVVNTGARASFTITSTGVVGFIETPEGILAWEPVAFRDPTAPAGLTAFYLAHDAIVPLHAHGDLPAPLRDSDESPDAFADAAPQGAFGPDRAVTLWVAHSFSGSNSQWFDVASSAFGAARSAFRTELGWDLTIVNALIYHCGSASCDASYGMTSSDPVRLLAEWGAAVQAAGFVSAYEAAHLFTGKNLTIVSDPVLGSAWQPGRYAVSKASGQSTYDLGLTVGHQLGHLFNGDHGIRDVPSPGRAERYEHVHSRTVAVCDFAMLGLCLLEHHETEDTTYTHHTMMWPSVVGNTGTLEHFLEVSDANVAWMRECNQHAWTGGTKTPGSATGFGAQCTS